METHRLLQKSFVMCTVLTILVRTIAAQQLNPDSLSQVWKDRSKSDSIRLEALYNITKDHLRSGQVDSGTFYAQIHYDFAEKSGQKKQMSRILNLQGIWCNQRGDNEGALEFYHKSMMICEEIGYQRGIAAVLNNIGRINEQQGEYEIAKNYFKRSQVIFDEIGEQRSNLIILNNIATIYSLQGDHKVAIDFYMRSLKVAEQIDSKALIQNLLNNIGFIYDELKNYPKALEYYEKSLVVAKAIENKEGISRTLNNLGSIYENKGDYRTALEHYHEGLKVAEETEDPTRIVASLTNIGSIYAIRKEYSQALEFQQRALRIAEKAGYKRGISFSLNNLAGTYQSQGNQSLALNYGDRAMAVATELGSVEQIKSSAEILHKAHRKMGNHRKSLDMYELYISMRDSLENIEVQREVAEKEIEYKYQKQALADSIAFAKQKELDDLTYEAGLAKAANQRNLVIAGFVLIIILVFIYFRIRSIKREAEKESLLQEIRLLKVEAVIKTASNSEARQQLILDKEKIEEAISNSLNPSDWNILETLFNNPAIGNNELADRVALSVAGVRSSLQKMYRFFSIDKSSNQRMILVMEATKISNNSFTEK